MFTRLRFMHLLGTIQTLAGISSLRGRAATAAIHEPLDCFATLAMTVWVWTVTPFMPFMHGGGAFRKYAEEV